jgi:hypothetical protein
MKNHYYPTEKMAMIVVRIIIMIKIDLAHNVIVKTAGNVWWHPKYFLTIKNFKIIQKYSRK